MIDQRGAAAVPSRARPPRLGRRALLTGLLGTGGVLLVGRVPEAPGEQATSGARVVGRAGAVTGPAAERPAPDAVAAAAPAGTGEPAGPAQRAGPVLADLDGLVLHVPALAPVLVAYHEAATVRAHPLTPLGRLRTNGNPTRFTAPTVDERGVGYDVQVSRGRSAGPTSAVDVVLDDAAPVLSPVAGTVVEVRDYLLYGSHDDVRIELRPDGREDLAVVLIHVEDPLVLRGERVEVGSPLAGAARLLPFHSIVDVAVAPRRLGHVHLEISTSRTAPEADAAA